MGKSYRLLTLCVFAALIALPGVQAATTGGSEDQKARDTVAALDKEFTEDRAAAREKLNSNEEYQQARKDRDRKKTRELSDAVMKPFNAAWSARYMNSANAYKGKPAEILFVASMLGNRLADEPGDLLKSTIETHAASPMVLELAKNLRRYTRLLPKDETQALLALLIEKNSSKEVQAHAYFARAAMVGRDASEEDKTASESDYKKVIALMPETSLLSMKARGPEYQKTRLQIGMEVPDVQGPDIDGVEFKLSDYRGKVVMIDFWGDW